MGADERAEADAWIRRAGGFLAHAETPLAEDPEVECYLAQQAAEMAVKAVFIARGLSHPHIHDMGELLRQLEKRGGPIPDEVDDAIELTDYAIETRYADVESEQPVISEADRQEAARLARVALEWAKSEIARAGE